MPTEIVEGDLARRVAALSPNKRAILQRLVSSSAAEISPAEEIPVQPRDTQRDFPLSAAQERMWFNHQWNPGQPLYNESFAIAIRGALNVGLLQKSFDFVMARHEIFTTTFHSANGYLFQRIGSGILPRMNISDLRQLDDADREIRYDAESRRILREPFRLEEGPLFRACIWIVDENHYRLIFAMHHIIFDGWSGGIFLRELLTSYMAMTEGRLPELPSTTVQYVDFAVWEQSRLEESIAELSRQEAYWKKQLEGMSGPPALPIDHPGVDGEIHTAGREVFLCPLASTEALKVLAQESGATLFVALLTIFKLLLARYSSQEDVVVAIPTTNRDHSALQNMVGVFINTAILRTDFSGDVSFRELLSRVRTTTLDAQANQELPLQKVVRLLDLQGDASRSLIQVMFDVQKKSSAMLDTPGLVIESMDVSNGCAKFDLVLAFEDTGTELKGILDYDKEKFEVETARQLKRHFLALVSSAIAHPDIPVSHLSILTDEELGNAEMHGLDTSTEFHPLAHVEVLARVHENPNALALQEGNTRFTYGEIYARAMRLASVLASHGIGSRQHVVLFLPPGADLVIAQFAVMMCGAAFVPIDPVYPRIRVEFMIRDCNAKVAVVNSHTRPTFSNLVNAIDVDCAGQPSGPNKVFDIAVQKGGDPSYVIYTSGSTGQPKGVSVSNTALANLIAWERRAFEISSQDRTSQIASVAFDASLFEIWPYLAAGASVHFLPRNLMSDSQQVRDWLVKNKITVSFAPTPLAEELIALPWPSKVSLRYLLTGGDRLRKRPSADIPFPVVNNYGPTENTIVSTWGIVDTVNNGSTPTIGRPIDNVWASVVDHALQPLPLGARGELIVGGKGLAIGYWNQPALTSDKFVTLMNGERAYRTGDFCRFRRGGEIEFLGRIDTQVKLRGCRIELGEIETTLLEHDAILDAVTDIRKLANGQEAIVAYIVPKDRMPTVETLRVFLSSRLTSYMLPSSFVRIQSIPKTPSGKIDRSKLPPIDSLNILEEPAKLPRTATEMEVAAIWKNLLRVDSVTLNDDFFHLGGDSLLATRFAAQVKEKFSVELPLNRMMSAPTIAALSDFIDGIHSCSAPLPDGVILLRSGIDNKASPPVFFTPPASGSSACYVTLAGALPDDRTIYGFEAAGLTHGSPIRSVTAQAHEYVAVLNRIYPQGPCYLAGWSLGGPVVFEIACQLRAAGREVAYLGLIDAGLPENGRLPGGASMMVPLWWAISYPFVERIPLNYSTIRLLARWMGIGLPESLADVWRRGPVAGGRFLASVVASGWRSSQVFLASMHGFRSYEPGFFDGDVTLFRTSQGGNLDKGQDAVLKSLGRMCRRVDVHEAPGSHMTLMLDPHITASFAPSFGETLNVAQQAGSDFLSTQFSIR